MSDMTPVQIKSEAPAAAPRRRGRPPKNKAGAEISNLQPAHTAVKKRGRPAKQHCAEIEPQKFSDAAPSEGVVVPALKEIADRSGNRGAKIMTAAEVRINMVPFPHFFLQLAFGCWGMPHFGLIEIGGREHVGKTTFSAYLAGAAMRGADAVCGMIWTESKPLLPTRMLRCFSVDPHEAKSMLDRLHIVDNIHTLSAMEQAVYDFVTACRQTAGVPMRKPVFVVVDSFSKLMSEGEAAGFSAYGGVTEKSAKYKETGTVSNLQHSKWAAAWTRRLTEYMPANNMILVLIHHQNAKIEMGGGASFIPAEMSDLYNDTFIGGRAFRQLAGMRLVLVPGKKFKIGEREIGQRVRGKVLKNSFGVPKADFEFIVVREMLRDGHGFLEPALNFDIPFAEWCAENKVLGTTVSNRRYTCKEIGAQSVSAEDFSLLFHANREVVEYLGKSLRIEGYYNVSDVLSSVSPFPSACRDAENEVFDAPNNADDAGDCEIKEKESSEFHALGENAEIIDNQDAP